MEATLEAPPVAKPAKNGKPKPEGKPPEVGVDQPAANKLDLKPVIVTRELKHVFTDSENSALARKLSEAIRAVGRAEEDFESVKSTYKAKATAAEAEVGRVASVVDAGFDLRPVECEVRYRPKDKEKDLHDLSTGELVLTEPMSPGDYEQELFQAESNFELREEIKLWAAGADKGVLVVGRFSGKWFAALRLSVGKDKLEERLDSEQPSVKKRADAVAAGGKRAQKWLKDTLKEAAKGFEEPIAKALESHKEREE